MLFHSYAFLFAFLPVVLLGSHALARWLGPVAVRVWLLLASLVFYAWWNPPFLALLLGSIGFNYALVWVLTRPDAPASQRRLAFGLGLAGNLGLLAQCKYLGFFTEVWNQATGAGLPVPPVYLPLAISFFTFQQIGCLVDAQRGRARCPSPLRYALWVVFFPHLIAGPIVRHDELLPQLERPGLGRLDAQRLAVGLTLLAVGLVKKVVLADGLAGWADPVFAAAAGGGALSAADAWGGALAYALQLYFDFSGYCDMALGVAAMLGVALPQNFDSPYMATGPIDFWRRWHVTLSRFLRDYLYIPLGGSRGAHWLRHRNLMLTMLLGGLWHGAGWTFLAWGAIHGALLCANHLYRARRGPAPAPSRLRAGAARGFTFAAVTLAWVPFRADSLAAAAQVWAAMAGAGAGAASGFPAEAWAAVGALLALVWLAPNSQAIAAAAASPAAGPARGPLLRWRPTPAWGFALGALALFAVADLARRSEFIYFRF